MRKWLLKVVEGRYRCWEDFLSFGMASAGHGNPPSAPMKLLSVGDDIYAYLDPRGYVGRGTVTQAAVLAGQFVVAGDFVAMDGFGHFDHAKLTDIATLKRSDMRDDGDDPRFGEWVVAVNWISTCPKKKPKRFTGMQVPSNTVEALAHPKTETVLAAAFGT